MKTALAALQSPGLFVPYSYAFRWRVWHTSLLDQIRPLRYLLCDLVGKCLRCGLINQHLGAGHFAGAYGASGTRLVLDDIVCPSAALQPV